jgi:hypothetical protein
MNYKYSKYCIASTKNGKRCKKYKVTDSEFCCVHSEVDELEEIIENSRWQNIKLFLIYLTFVFHLCLFKYVFDFTESIK